MLTLSMGGTVFTDMSCCFPNCCSPLQCFCFTFFTRKQKLLGRKDQAEKLRFLSWQGWV